MDKSEVARFYGPWCS